MSRFNLLDEPWISVVYDEQGAAKEVSLTDLFTNAHQYRDLAGDTKTQDFAVLRVLLAVLHTVFSRFNAQGEVYEYLEVDERFRQIEPVDEYDIEDYDRSLYDTWEELWKNQKFPEIINRYLEKWRDRFYLFDEQYPFFQVRKEDIAAEKISKEKASNILGKNINRTISESGNKLALFSPKNNQEKGLLVAHELVRWLLTFQGYSGLSDKVIFGKEKYKSSKGWLFDIGAVYIKGDSLFETLLLNCILPYNEYDNLANIQQPCWEINSSTQINHYLSGSECTSIASLYTTWSRAIYIDPEIDLDQPFNFEIVKLPELNHKDNFLEPMTIWKYNNSGDNKNSYTPKKHSLNQSLWRSFGLLSTGARKPGIINWLKDTDEVIKNRVFNLISISMQDDGNATSWVPTDEIIDSLFISNLILTDIKEGGWVPRINDVVVETKRVVSQIYKKYINEIKEIRQISNILYTDQIVEALYFKIDAPFRQWLFSIQLDDDKEFKIKEWREVLKKIVKNEAEIVLRQGGTRDYLGIVTDNQVKNIATAYNSFEYWLHQQLK